jgi:hypothetical protein
LAAQLDHVAGDDALRDRRAWARLLAACRDGVHRRIGRKAYAAGVEFGFNGRSKVVLKGDRNSKEFKQKNDNDIKINDTQMNAVVRLGLDNIALYAKYSLTDMFANSAYAQGQNPGQHLFSFGVCLFGI